MIVKARLAFRRMLQRFSTHSYSVRGTRGGWNCCDLLSLVHGNGLEDNPFSILMDLVKRSTLVLFSLLTYHQGGGVLSRCCCFRGCGWVYMGCMAVWGLRKRLGLGLGFALIGRMEEGSGEGGCGCSVLPLATCRVYHR